MTGKPRNKAGTSVTRLVINNFDTESHYRLHQAASYSGETLSQFITRAVKQYIANSDIPRKALQHPTYAPGDVVEWYIMEPSIQLVTFIDQSGVPWTDRDLIEYAQKHINDGLKDAHVTNDTSSTIGDATT